MYIFYLEWIVWNLDLGDFANRCSLVNKIGIRKKIYVKLFAPRISNWKLSQMTNMATLESSAKYLDTRVVHRFYGGREKSIKSKKNEICSLKILFWAFSNNNCLWWYPVYLAFRCMVSQPLTFENIVTDTSLNPNDLWGLIKGHFSKFLLKNFFGWKSFIGCCRKVFQIDFFSAKSSTYMSYIIYIYHLQVSILHY